MSDLKPCPFCGGEAQIYEWPDLEALVSGKTPDPPSVNIACIQCEGGHPPFYGKPEAIAAWNTRADTAK